jgi:hypothetical protein
MLRRPTHRLTAAFLVALALLFSQLVLASYVCPGQSGAAAMAESMAAGEPCEGMDQEQPALCHQYSAGAAQSPEAVKPLAVSAPAVVEVFVLPMVLQTLDAIAIPVAALTEAQPPPDTVLLYTLSLRV